MNERNTHVASPFREILDRFCRHDEYCVDLFSKTTGTEFIGMIEASFSDMFDLFGAPLRVDDGTVSNEWRFAGAHGTFCVYDGVPGSETINGDCKFSIGAPSHTAGHEFAHWLADKVYARRLTLEHKFLA